MQRVFMKTTGDAEDDFVHTTEFFSYVCHEVSAAPAQPLDDELEQNPKTCSVVGCQQPFPTTRPRGWNISCTGSGHVCHFHRNRYNRYEQRARKARNYSDDGALQSLWTERELEEDARRERAFVSDVPPTSIETVQLQYKGRQMSFDRDLGSTTWTTSAHDAHADFLPLDFSANKLECQV